MKRTKHTDQGSEASATVEQKQIEYIEKLNHINESKNYFDLFKVSPKLAFEDFDKFSDILSGSYLKLASSLEELHEYLRCSETTVHEDEFDQACKKLLQGFDSLKTREAFKDYMMGHFGRNVKLKENASSFSSGALSKLCQTFLSVSEEQQIENKVNPTFLRAWSFFCLRLDQRISSWIGSKAKGINATESMLKKIKYSTSSVSYFAVFSEISNKSSFLQKVSKTFFELDVIVSTYYTLRSMKINPEKMRRRIERRRQEIKELHRMETEMQK